MFLLAVQMSFPSSPWILLLVFLHLPQDLHLLLPCSFLSYSLPAWVEAAVIKIKMRVLCELWAAATSHKSRESHKIPFPSVQLWNMQSGCPHPRTAHCKASWFCSLLPIFHVSSSTVLPVSFLISLTTTSLNHYAWYGVFLLDKMYWMFLFSIKHRT